MQHLALHRNDAIGRLGLDSIKEGAMKGGSLT